MKFAESPFCFEGKLKTCIVDGRITDELEKSLLDRDIRVIKTPKCKDVYDAISYHPDIQFFNCGNGKIIVAPNLYESYIEILNDFYSSEEGYEIENIKIDLIKGDKPLSKKYPDDIAYNVCIVGKYALHNFEYTDKEVLKYLDENEFERINIKQGYSKCSICVVDDKSIITADKGILDSIEKSGADIDYLLIEQGNIDLFDMNFGFIGGCTGILSDSEVGFLGKVENHPDFEKIKEFLNKYGKRYVSLSKEKLIDLGSIIPIVIE